MGYGSVSIATTYGTDNYKEKLIPFMSQDWVKTLNYTATSFKNNGLVTDASLTSAWSFGGPNVVFEMGTRYSVVIRVLTTVPKEKVNIQIDTLSKGKIQALSTYSADREYIEFTQHTNEDGILTYIFPVRKYDVYALLSCPVGQRMKRSGLGGEGLTIDHFDGNTVHQYLKRSDAPFQSRPDLHSTFNGSYEAYGADYTPVLLDEFKMCRGYDLRKALYLLDPSDKSDKAYRVLCDHRETVSDLLLDNFVKVWHKWMNSYGAKTVEQARGTLANRLSLYRASDIP